MIKYYMHTYTHKTHKFIQMKFAWNLIGKEINICLRFKAFDF